MRENKKQELERRAQQAEARANLFASLVKFVMQAVGQSRLIVEKEAIALAAKCELQISADRNALTPDERIKFAHWGNLVVVQLAAPVIPIQAAKVDA